MSERFVSLKCESCGGKLDVYDDMEHFACGSCGTEMIVHRRGGTVVLKAVSEAIKKVQVGTDKTAAELAIARYDKELAALQARQAELNRDDIGCSVLVLGGMLFVGFFFLSNGMAELGWTFVIFGGGGLVYGFFRLKRRNQEMIVLQKAAHEIAQQRAEKKKIADG